MSLVVFRRAVVDGATEPENGRRRDKGAPHPGVRHRNAVADVRRAEALPPQQCCQHIVPARTGWNGEQLGEVANGFPLRRSLDIEQDICRGEQLAEPPRCRLG